MGTFGLVGESFGAAGSGFGGFETVETVAFGGVVATGLKWIPVGILETLCLHDAAEMQAVSLVETLASFDQRKEKVAKGPSSCLKSQSRVGILEGCLCWKGRY